MPLVFRGRHSWRLSSTLMRMDELPYRTFSRFSTTGSYRPNRPKGGLALGHVAQALWLEALLQKPAGDGRHGDSLVCSSRGNSPGACGRSSWLPLGERKKCHKGEKSSLSGVTGLGHGGSWRGIIVFLPWDYESPGSSIAMREPSLTAFPFHARA